MFCATFIFQTRSSVHLKKWLASHGLNYKTCFNGLIEQLTEEREEMLSEKEN